MNHSTYNYSCNKTSPIFHPQGDSKWFIRPLKNNSFDATSYSTIVGQRAEFSFGKIHCEISADRFSENDMYDKRYLIEANLMHIIIISVMILILGHLANSGDFV